VKDKVLSILGKLGWLQSVLYLWFGLGIAIHLHFLGYCLISGLGLKGLGAVTFLWGLMGWVAVPFLLMIPLLISLDYLRPSSSRQKPSWRSIGLLLLLSIPTLPSIYIVFYMFYSVIGFIIGLSTLEVPSK